MNPHYLPNQYLAQSKLSSKMPAFHGWTALVKLPLEGKGFRVGMECAGRRDCGGRPPHRRWPLDRNPDRATRGAYSIGISASSEPSPGPVIGRELRLQVPHKSGPRMRGVCSRRGMPFRFNDQLGLTMARVEAGSSTYRDNQVERWSLKPRNDDGENQVLRKPSSLSKLDSTKWSSIPTHSWPLTGLISVV